MRLFIPIPQSTVVNGIRHRERIKATLSAVHLRGLSLDAGAKVVAELLAPLKAPQIPETDLLFPILKPTTYVNNKELILSFYADSREGRQELPLLQIRGLALIDGKTDFSSLEAPAPDSTLAYLAAQHKSPCKGGYLILRRADEQDEVSDVILYCPRSLHQAQQIADFYFRVFPREKAQLSLSQLGA